MALKRTFLWMQCGILLALYPSFSVAQTAACTSYFNCNPQAFGVDDFVDLKGIVVAEDASIGDQLFVCQWNETTATADPPSGELFEKYFAVDTTETSKWTCTVKSPLTWVPDYPDVNSTIKANTIFTGFSGFESCTFEVTIAVTDVNSNPPEFDQGSYSVDISEDSQVGALVPTDIKIRDQDKDVPNNVVDLSVNDNCPISPDPSEYQDFGGSFTDVKFKLRTRVDYEQTPSYDCTLTLKDKGTPELSATANLKIMIQDMPDEDPVFDSAFYTTEVTDPVPEEGGTKLETSPGPIHAEDGDKGAPSPVTYSMEEVSKSDVGTTYFAIDSTTGVVSLVATLDDDILEKKRFIFQLTATDESQAKGTSILEIALPPVPTTTPEPTTTSTTLLTETTTTPSSSTHESSPSSSETPSTTSSSVTESTTSPSVTESTSSSSMTLSTTTPSVTESTLSSSMTQSTTTPSVTESTLSSSMTQSTTTPGVTESTSSSSMTQSTTSPIMTESTTSPSMTYSTSSSSMSVSITSPVVTEVTSSSMTQSTTSPIVTDSTTTTTTPGPEMSLEFTKDAYAADVPERYGAAFLKVDVIVKGFDRSDVVFSLEDDDSAHFEINSPEGEIQLKTGVDTPSGEYSFTVRARGPEETKLESTARVNVAVLTASPKGLSLTQSLYRTTLMENTTQARLFEIKLDNTEAVPASFCIINVTSSYDGYFQVDQHEGKWYLEMNGEPIDYEKTQEVSFILQALDEEAQCKNKTVQSLFRYEALVLVSIINLNDEDPVFQIPSSAVETVFYPRDMALQRIVGPVITLQADDGDLKDSSLGENISYSITNKVAGFSVEKDTGAIYVKSEFSCEGEGCQIKVKASDADNHATDEATIIVKPLDMSSIYTLALNDVEVWKVDEKLRNLSGEVGLQISKVYVNSEVNASTNVQQRYPGYSPHRSRRQSGQPTEYLSSRSSSNAEEHRQIEVNVYAMNEGGNLVTLEELNKKLSESKYNEAVPFVDEEIFNPPATEGDDTGLIAGISVLAVLLGIVLLAGGFLMYRKHRSRTANKPKNISTVGGAYPNHGYSDDEGETKSTTSKRSDVIVNGSLGRTDDVDTFGELSEGKVGLRRTNPGAPEFYGISSREPPPSYNKEDRPPSKPLVGSLSKDTGSSLYPSLTSTSSVEPQPTTTYLTKNPKKAPPPLNSAPTKSILRGKSGSDTRQDIPLYDTSFQQKDTAKQDNTGSEREDEEEKSVAFKVLVDMKVVETENAGPAQKALAVAAAKSDALGILEANRKKMEESAGGGDEDDDDDDAMLSSL